MSDLFKHQLRLTFRGSLYLITRETDFRCPLTDARALIDTYGVVSRAGSRPNTALARASIVMTMSGWQAFIETLAEAMLHSLEPSKRKNGGPDDDAAYQRDHRYWMLRRGEIRKVISDFSTPNSQNCRNLLLRLGFDPWDEWAVLDGNQNLTSVQARQRLDTWLQVRHALAHGDALPEVDVLDRSSAGSPMVTKRSAERCNRFVRALIAATLGHFYPNGTYRLDDRGRWL